MKRIAFALACIIGVMFFASCTQEQIDEIMAQKPVVEFMAEEGFISKNCEATIGDVLNFKVKIAPNKGSEASLNSFTFTIMDLNGSIVWEEEPEITNPDGETIFTESYTPGENPTTFTVTATVKDAYGKMNAAVVIVDYVQPVEAELGVFKGTVNLNGTLESDTVFHNLPVRLNDLETTITLGSLGTDNKVSAAIVIDGTQVTRQGHLENNVITFDEFNLNNQTVSVPVGSFEYEIQLNLTINMTGTLDNDVMTLDGVVTGTSNVNLFAFISHVTMEGSIAGELQKMP